MNQAPACVGEEMNVPRAGSELIPDYRKSQRQCDAMKLEKWGKVLDAAGKIAEIDAAPWTPKFWALLIKAIGMSAVATRSDRREELSNEYQAYKFMSYIERSASRFG